MLQFDQESQTVRRSALGLSGTAGGPGRVLDDLARVIEDMQRQQSETLAHIVERLRAVEPSRSTGMRTIHSYTNVDSTAGHAYEPGDEPWDADSAEALMRSYEEDTARQERASLQPRMSKSQQDWIGARFNDLTQKITQALADLKSGSAMAALEQRLDAFQDLVSSALKDVVRRADLEGMRLIETHVSELSAKLDELERHVARIDGIESDVRNVMAQVSDERIAKLLDYDSRFAADLEAVARRAAEEVHNRLAPGSEQTQQESRRHEELRALIEASIQDRRQAESQVAPSDRYDELKSLLEQAIQEQRQNEQTAFGMLDTLQQALVTVLDRMDALEQQHVAAPASSAASSAETRAAAASFASARPYEASYDDRTDMEPAAHDATRYAFRDTRYDSFSGQDEPEATAPVEVPAAFADPGAAEHADSEDPASDPTDSTIERLRRDFVADARRAKLKAAANRAEALGELAEPQKAAGSGAQSRATILTHTPRSALGTGPSNRLFGMSTKLLAGVLALIIAINGGLLLLTRKQATPRPAPEIVYPSASEQNGAVQGPTYEGRATPDGSDGAPVPGPRSDLDGDTVSDGQTLTLYGFHDDVLNPPPIESTDGTPDIPRGVAIARPAGSIPDAVVAEVYEQQVLAGLSGKLGTIAAGRSADALLPEQSGRIEAAYQDPALVPEGETAEGASALDLPPATVGPMSLRLAAANGDASAEFEVGARLAEGKGTGQNYAEALRWYQRAAAKGFAQAQYRLGTLYERGLGVAKDLERAKVWYSRAAEGGNVKAMHNLAVLIAGGEQGEPDYAAAAPWFRKAAEHGLADSQYNLGVLLENGLAGTTDRAGAYMWYALAAKGGDPDAVARRDALKAALSADELASAEAKIAGFRARRATPLANDARAAGEDWKKRVSNDTNT